VTQNRTVQLAKERRRGKWSLT